MGELKINVMRIGGNVFGVVEFLGVNKDEGVADSWKINDKKI